MSGERGRRREPPNQSKRTKGLCEKGGKAVSWWGLLAEQQTGLRESELAEPKGNRKRVVDRKENSLGTGTPWNQEYRGTRNELKGGRMQRLSSGEAKESSKRKRQAQRLRGSREKGSGNVFLETSVPLVRATTQQWRDGQGSK
ncbi:hypothetical protein TRVL_05007 [Trypanosoma vivax]|nr:hypothetical protein TRVL_05007 [Trypanosoma vivax]